VVWQFGITLLLFVFFPVSHDESSGRCHRLVVVSALAATQQRSRSLHIVVAAVIILKHTLAFFAFCERVVGPSNLALRHFQSPFPPGLHGFLCHVGHFPLHFVVLWGRGVEDGRAV
jgi:hypothetical protein